MRFPILVLTLCILKINWITVSAILPAQKCDLKKYGNGLVYDTSCTLRLPGGIKISLEDQAGKKYKATKEGVEIGYTEWTMGANREHYLEIPSRGKIKPDGTIEYNNGLTLYPTGGVKFGAISVSKKDQSASEYTVKKKKNDREEVIDTTSWERDGSREYLAIFSIGKLWNDGIVEYNNGLMLCPNTDMALSGGIKIFKEYENSPDYKITRNGTLIDIVQVQEEKGKKYLKIPTIGKLKDDSTIEYNNDLVFAIDGSIELPGGITIVKGEKGGSRLLIMKDNALIGYTMDTFGAYFEIPLIGKVRKNGTIEYNNGLTFHYSGEATLPGEIEVKVPGEDPKGTIYKITKGGKSLGTAIWSGLSEYRQTGVEHKNIEFCTHPRVLVLPFCRVCPTGKISYSNGLIRDADGGVILPDGTEIFKRDAFSDSYNIEKRQRGSRGGTELKEGVLKFRKDGKVEKDGTIQYTNNLRLFYDGMIELPDHTLEGKDGENIREMGLWRNEREMGLWRNEREKGLRRNEGKNVIIPFPYGKIESNGNVIYKNGLVRLANGNVKFGEADIITVSPTQLRCKNLDDFVACKKVRDSIIIIYPETLFKDISICHFETSVEPDGTIKYANDLVYSREGNITLPDGTVFELQKDNTYRIKGAQNKDTAMSWEAEDGKQVAYPKHDSIKKIEKTGTIEYKNGLLRKSCGKITFKGHKVEPNTYDDEKSIKAEFLFPSKKENGTILPNGTVKLDRGCKYKANGDIVLTKVTTMLKYLKGSPCIIPEAKETIQPDQAS